MKSPVEKSLFARFIQWNLARCRRLGAEEARLWVKIPARALRILTMPLPLEQAAESPRVMKPVA